MTRLFGVVCACAMLAAGCAGDEVLVSGSGAPNSSVVVPSLGTAESPAELATTTTVAFGRSTAETPEMRRLEEAAFFRINLVNLTGQQHLSMSDYAAIRDDACRVANDPDELVALSRRWGFGVFSNDENGANAIWVSVRDVCPEVLDITDRLPFASTGASGPESVGDAPSDAQVSFVDVSILDDPHWRWSGLQSMLAATTVLSAEDAVEHFRGAFSEGWTVNEVLGPVKLQNRSARFWSMDVSSRGFSGVVEVHDSESGVFVRIVTIDGPYPLADPRLSP